MQLEGHRCFIQPESKKRKPSPEEEEEVPENGYDVSAFFDTECRQGEREPEDEPVEESLQELLFFYFECRQENGNHEPNLYIIQNEAGEEWTSKATILGTNSANGCSRQNMPTVRSWLIISKGTIVTLSSSIYVNMVSSRMSSCVVLKFLV